VRRTRAIKRIVGRLSTSKWKKSGKSHKKKRGKSETEEKEYGKMAGKWVKTVTFPTFAALPTLPILPQLQLNLPNLIPPKLIISLKLIKVVGPVLGPIA